MTRTKISACALSLSICLIAVPAIARTCGPGANQNLGNAMDQSAANAAQTAVNRVEQVMTKPAPVSQTTCLDKYLNGGLLNVIFAVPDFSGLMTQLENQACSMMDSEISKATQPINQSLHLPYGMGGVTTNAGVGSSSQSGVNVQQQNNQVQAPSLMQRIMSVFK